jgi:hypothetical protein
VPGTGEVARFPAETLGTHKDGNTEYNLGVGVTWVWELLDLNEKRTAAQRVERSVVKLYFGPLSYSTLKIHACT